MSRRMETSKVLSELVDACLVHSMFGY